MQAQREEESEQNFKKTPSHNTMNSYKPPPSFLGEGADYGGGKERYGKTSNGSMEIRKSRRRRQKDGKAWAPAFVVGDVPETMELSQVETLQASRDLPIATNAVLCAAKPGNNSTGAILSLDAATRTGEPISRHTSRPNNLAPPCASKSRTAVAWKDHLEAFGTNGCRSTNRSLSTHNCINSNSRMASKNKGSNPVDKAMQQMRLEWSNLLVCNAFKSYSQMICDADDDLPDFESAGEMEAQEYWDEHEGMGQIKDKMLNDSNLTEREVMCFFKGFHLFQTKVYSLQSQLQGAKAMHRMATRSLVAPRSMVASRSMVLSRDEPQRKKFDTTHLAKEREHSTVPKAERSPSSNYRNLDKSQESGTEHGQVGLVSSRGHRDRIAKKQLNESRTQSKKVRSLQSLRVMSIQRIRRETSVEDSSDIRKLLEELEEAENRQKKLEKQLAQAGIVIAEDIPYVEAKEMVAKIASRMTEIGSSDVADKKLREEYFKLEKDMEKYSAALQLTDEWAEEQEELEQEWEISVAAKNKEALVKLRRHMPVDVQNQSEATLSTLPSPNGKVLPIAIARKFKRTNCLQLLRVNPDDIFPMHPSTLENLRVGGLTLTERRAMFHHLREVGPRWKSMGSDKMMERKWIWFNMMKSNFKETVDSWRRHVADYGPPGNHPYSNRENSHRGCPLIGRQCPLRADKQIDYDNDYGHPEGAQYFEAEVRKFDVDSELKAKQEAADDRREEKTLERNSALKKHYKGKILQVSVANGSCDSMDEAMDRIEATLRRWAAQSRMDCKDTSHQKTSNLTSSIHDALNELRLSAIQFAERSGMQIAGKRDVSMETPDLRSMIEISLCEEVIEAAATLFKDIELRAKELNVKDGRLKTTTTQLACLLDDLHQRNTKSMQTLGKARLARSRPLRTSEGFESDMVKGKSANDLAASRRSSESKVSKGAGHEETSNGKSNAGLSISGVRSIRRLECFLC